MIEVGNGGMTDDEYQAHFSLWALIKSPILIGCDVRNMSTSTLTILSNQEVLYLNQDDLGVQGHRVSPAGDQEIWAGPLMNGDLGVVLFNRGASAANVTFSFSLLGLKAGTSANIRDLVQHKDLGKFTDVYSAEIKSHASQTLRLDLVATTRARTYKTIWDVYQAHPESRAILHPF